MPIDNKPDAVILCGGQGTRLRSVLGDGPKSLAEVGGRPFLEILLDQLKTAGWRRVVLCTGYGSAALQQHFNSTGPALEICFSEEQVPLGTGGALRNALPLLKTDMALVMNGDSYVSLHLADVHRHYLQRKTDVLMVVVPADTRTDAGAVAVDSLGRVTGFAEKTKAGGARFYNAGVYLIARPLLEAVPSGRPVSLEQELIPKWIERGMHAYIHQGRLLDIGTPERLADANSFFEQLPRSRP